MAGMWHLVLGPAVAFVIVTVLGFVLRGLLRAGVRRWAGESNGATQLLRMLRVPSALWVLVLALYVAVEVADELERLPRRASQQLSLLLEAAIIVSVTISVASIVATLIRQAGERRAFAGPATGLAQAAARLAILLIGCLVLLADLGIQITPLLTALGVGGLAVSLALQDTLSNFFAGFHLLADRPIRVGDFVRIAEGLEGYVVDVSWRSTRIRTLQNNVVVVPNAKIAQSMLINFDLPESRVAVPLKVSVSYASDPERVEAILMEEATAAAERLPGLLATPAPLVRLIPGFGEFSLDFTLVIHVARYVEQFPVQHELRKRILARFRSEGVEIPFPIRTVQLRPSPPEA